MVQQPISLQQPAAAEAAKPAPVPAVRMPTAAYAELKRKARERGLLDRQPLYYTLRMTTNFLLLAISVWLIIITESFALQLLNALVMAFAYVQIAFVGHNSGHRQVSKTSFADEMLTLLHFGFLLGTSASWWVDKHNDHHGQPNVVDADPDIDFPMVAFTEEQALSKHRMWRFVVAYQAFFFPIMLMLVTFNMRFASIRKLLGRSHDGPAKRPVIEALAMATNLGLYATLLLSQMSALQALIFFFVHHAVIGVYMGSVFAINHKGMPVLPQDHDFSFMELQILTSRNIHNSPLIDGLYGGLNYQIEHHLFPTMPQNKLRAARDLVKAYCQERGIPYYETGFIRAMAEVFQHLHHVSAPVRRRTA